MRCWVVCQDIKINSKQLKLYRRAPKGSKRGVSMQNILFLEQWLDNDWTLQLRMSIYGKGHKILHDKRDTLPVSFHLWPQVFL